MTDLGTEAGKRSYGSEIRLNTSTAAPPANSYIGVTDQLQVFIASSTVNQTATVFARILLPNGTIVPNQWNVSAVNGRAGRNFYQQLAEGFLLSLSVQSSSSQQSGETFVRAALIRGTVAQNTVTMVLIEGYPFNQSVLSWPGSELQLPTTGRGNMRTIVGTQPPPGQSAVETVPANVLWRLCTLFIHLDTSATVGNRRPSLQVSDGTSVSAAIWLPIDVPASTGTGLSFTDGVGITPTSAPYLSLSGPTNIYLPPGYKITIFVFAMQPTDQLLAPCYMVEEWLA